MDPVLTDVNTKIDNALLHLQRELAAIRAGRANPSLIEDIQVDAYGTKMRLQELGTIGAPQNSLLTIQVWDASVIKDVQKAIMEANLGLNPSIEGNVVRLPIPPLSEERREEFVKLAQQKGEECKVEIRQIRAGQRESWEREKTDNNFGEDEMDRREKLLQNLVDRSILKVDELVGSKKEELMKV